MVNIKVAVRIRPLSERELLHGEEIIVRKENKTVLVTNPKIPERQDGDSRQRTRRFTVDFCYDSRDSEGGSQEAVYGEIGSEVLHSMYEGYNACVLAYGHSASGKTYTIMGLQNDPGLTPRLCEGLFDKIEEKCPQGNIRVRVIISFLEIYNEKVRDLLGSEETGATCGNFSLRVREHPKLGPYVQGLSEHSVGDKGKLLQLLTSGNQRRSTAATESNIHSSRSHAVFTIQFKQSDGGNFETEKSSKVHLVDLAGSERARSSQSKARLQEGANINKSLATLGNVISALAESYDSGVSAKEHSSSKTWQPFVPYRDSVLTWLLKDTLGGNSNTIMIATISPAGSCVSETVNTLRYAKRAKKIVNQPIVNEDPKIRTIRELRKEIARLKNLLIFFRSCGGEVARREGRSESGQSNLESPESKWTEPEGNRITIEEEKPNKKENCSKGTERELTREKIVEVKEERSQKESGGSKNERKAGVRAGGDACEIGDEKKSDVNGSVNDNFSHETQFFSDSLESFSCLFPKNGNSWDDDGKPETGDDEFEMRASNGLTGEFGSNENLSRKEAVPEMLHRSRPDLIKGISTRGKDNGLPLGSSHSCTDVSNLSQSTSENSLNSSAGSTEAHAVENRSQQNPGGSKQETGTEKREKGARKNSGGHEVPGRGSQTKDRRLEIVEAVTSRLYVAKKKPDGKSEVSKKEDDDDCGEVEELKLCKRARMKLFDISRKLAMNRKMKKTVDSNTQTDCATSTIRVKEKCVTTDSSGDLGFETTAAEETFKGESKKPYVIMNQVFIPRDSNYVVECGEVVRVEGPEAPPRHESATQTSAACKNAETSPITFSPRDEDSFSDDSLDLEESAGCREVSSGGDRTGSEKPSTEMRMKFSRPVCLFRDFEKRFKEKSIPEGSVEASLNGLPLSVFVEGRTNPRERIGFFIADGSTGWKPENVSSENSFTSTEGTENNSLSETSSEEFVFYENPRDFLTKGKATSDRELYTITENSEQSDPGDGFSDSVQRQREEQGEARKWVENSQQHHRIENETKAEVKTTESGKLQSRISVEHPDKVFSSFSQVFDSQKHAQDKVPKCVSSPTRDTLPKYPDRLAKTMYRFPENGSETEKTDVRCWSADGEGKTKQQTDFQFNSQKQYLNLNISSSGKAPPFSVDTNLFGKASRRDQSTDTMSTSADSITFVFMGPAKPETSVLMEIIGRSLGRSSRSSEEVPFGQRKSRSRGVQCDANLMRSVSVDTAMIALSRIARNQETSPEMQRTTSLGKLNPDEMLEVLSGGKLRSQLGNGCQCELNEEKKKCALKYSVGTCTDEENGTTKKEKVEEEKRKKTVSWFEENQKEPEMTKRENRDVSVESEELYFGLGCGDFPEVETDKPNDLKLRLGSDSEHPEKRVRFLKEKTSEEIEFGMKREPVESDSLSAFLKEATQLLKNINSRSRPVFSEETTEEFDGEPNRKKEETRRGLKIGKKPEGVTKMEKKDTSWRWKTTTPEENRLISLTWPRRRPTTGKPPTGTKSRFPRSPLPSRFESPHPNGGPSNPRSWSPGSRTGFNGQSWNLSNLSVALSNSCLGEVESRPPSSSRSSFCNETNRDVHLASPKRTIDPLADLELDLKESCRRLEMATEHDRMREKIQERKKKCFEYTRIEEGHGEPEDTEEELEVENKKPREVIKRRKTEGCAGSCVCEASGREPCKHLWSRGCRSSFELDSFGPGSKHCHQLCMFCRKKEAEIYYSAVSLNSECSSGRCRLNYYGFCPCSPVKLNQVVLSPRAYMQRLLALRKRIVNETKHVQIDPDEIQRRNCRDLSWRARPWLSSTQNFT